MPRKRVGMLKAWHVFELACWSSNYKTIVNSLLVFASTRNKARSIAFNAGLWEYEDYIDVRANRCPEYDYYVRSLARSDRIIETNDDLPAGAPDFYDDDI